jgi:hypothetical protein
LTLASGASMIAAQFATSITITTPLPFMRTLTHSAIRALLACLVGSLTAFAAEPKAPETSSVKQAAYNATTPGDSPRTVTFHRQPVHVRDQAEQSLSFEMRLATSIRRGNELVERNQATVRSDQRRVVTTTEIEGDRISAVTVRYVAATRQIDSGETESAAPAPQSVQGKTYNCRRESGDNGKLIVTDSNGNTPPSVELEFVAQSMEMVGRPNPLAQFLDGRTLRVGDTVKLPKEIASQMFNLGEQFGEVTQFDLTLEKTNVGSNDGGPCAIFKAQVDAASSDASQMRLQVEGLMVVQIETCRAAGMQLTGPIGMSETRGSASTRYQVLGTGRMQMSIASSYRDAMRKN